MHCIIIFFCIFTMCTRMNCRFFVKIKHVSHWVSWVISWYLHRVRHDAPEKWRNSSRKTIGSPKAPGLGSKPHMVEFPNWASTASRELISQYCIIQKKWLCIGVFSFISCRRNEIACWFSFNCSANCFCVYESSLAYRVCSSSYSYFLVVFCVPCRKYRNHHFWNAETTVLLIKYGHH